ncbi:MAG: hypothetical protein M1820_005880 [Bogoriella megaspora]|nr:MAG: hypothetical protein M1820_005880 [Bogoriella megaspora]
MGSSEDMRPSALLLLPPPPSSPSYPNLHAAYNPALKAALQDAQLRSTSSTKGSAGLDVAVPCKLASAREQVPRSTHYTSSQTLIAGLYKLICVIGSQHDINLEDADGVDVRVIPFNYPSRYSADGLEPRNEDFEGPFVNLQRLALCGRPWTKLYGVESEEGFRLCRDFLELNNTTINVQHVQGGIVQKSSQTSTGENALANAMPHYSVAVGGTFDHLHIGHKLLLTMTALAAESANPSSSWKERTLTIGITGDELLKNKKYAEFLESWDTRQAAVIRFMLSFLDFCPEKSPLRASFITTTTRADPGPNGHVVSSRLASGLTINCVAIQDPYGPTITDSSISALVISAETRAGGKAVNDKRTEQGWPELQVFEVDVLDADYQESGNAHDEEANNFGSKISSTEIRRLQAEKKQSLQVG